MKNTLSDILIQSKREAHMLEEELMETGGEITPEIESRLVQAENLAVTESKKIDGLSYVMDHFENQAKYWKAQAAAIQKVAKACENVQKRIKEGVKYTMISMNIEELVGVDKRFKLTKCKQSLVIDHQELPSSFKMEVSEWVPDKEKILKALDAGEEVPGCTLEGGKAMRVYMNKEGK